VQKRAIELCRSQAKPVIVATQVLESMTHSPVPTRAETSDCANAILDGADAVMLSGETSVGDYPIITVETMARIIENTERKGFSRIAPYLTIPKTRGGAVTHAAADISETLDVKYIVTFTQSGDSAQRMSRLRPRTPMLALTPNPDTQKRLALSWGVRTAIVPKAETTDDMVNIVDSLMKDTGRTVDGDLVVIVSGTPIGIPGTTNSIVVHKVGQVRK
jgi:pyruvate kinase